MRGNIEQQRSFISFLDPERMIDKDHVIREVKSLVDDILLGMEDKFNDMYAKTGRPSVPPERLLKAKVLQALFSIRSNVQLVDRAKTDLLFRWFLDMNPDEEMFDNSTFTHNQQRLLDHAVGQIFMIEVVKVAKKNGWVSNEHFSVDGTLIEAYAGMKSFQPKPDPNAPPPPEPPAGESGNKTEGDSEGKTRKPRNNAWVNFRGKGFSNETHESTTDPEAKYIRKGPGKEAKLCHTAHAVMENRNGLCVMIEVTPSVGASEPTVAVEQIRQLQDQGFDPKTVGADKGYHCEHFVEELQAEGITPHCALVEKRDTYGVVKDAAYTVSQVMRRRIEELFGWTKTTGLFRKSRFRGVARTDSELQFTIGTLNLVRMAKIRRNEQKEAQQVLPIPVCA
jgi:transposase